MSAAMLSVSDAIAPHLPAARDGSLVLDVVLLNGDRRAVQMPLKLCLREGKAEYWSASNLTLFSLSGRNFRSREGEIACVLNLDFGFWVALEHIDGALSDGDHGEGRNGRRYPSRGQRTRGASNLPATNIV